MFYVRAGREILIKVLTPCLKQASCKIKSLKLVHYLLPALMTTALSQEGASEIRSSVKTAVLQLWLWEDPQPCKHGNTSLTQTQTSVTAGRADNTQLVPTISPCTAQLHTAPSCYSPLTNFLHQHLHVPFEAALCHHEKGAAFSSLHTQLAPKPLLPSGLSANFQWNIILSLEHWLFHLSEMVERSEHLNYCHWFMSHI